VDVDKSNLTNITGTAVNTTMLIHINSSTQTVDPSVEFWEYVLTSVIYVNKY